MRMARFFCDTISQNSRIVISDVQFRHLARVLRLKKGDSVELFDGKGTVAGAIIEEITKNKAQLKIQTAKVFGPPDKQRIIIASSMAKGRRFETVVAACCQLGVDRIIPVIFERTVKQAGSLQEHQRLETIAIESAKQCQRLFLPVIDRPSSLQETIKKLQTEYPGAKIIFGSLTEDAESVINFNFGPEDCFAFIGPEGGLTEIEENLLKEIKAKAVRLTDTILRIETAAIAFAAILSAKRNARQ